MKRYSIYAFAAWLILSIGAFMACQTKEVTSAKVYIQQNDWDNAIAQLEQAVKAYPNDPEAHYLLGKGYGIKGRFEDMNREFDASLKIAPKFEKEIQYERSKDWVENYNKGVRKFNEQKTDEAIENFKTAITIDPTKVEAYRNLAVAYVRSGDVDNAIKYFKKALEIDPKSVETLNNLGTVYYQHQKYQEAIDIFKNVLEIDPDNSDAIATMGLAYHMLGDTDKALEAYNTALQKNPGNADLIFNYATLLMKKGQYEEAAKKFKEVLQTNPEDYEANLSVADALLQVAEKFSKQANELETKNEEANQEQVKELREVANKFYKGAIPYIKKALELKPNVRTLWFNLGVAYVHLGEAEKGAEAFKKAEELEKQEKQQEQQQQN